MAGTARIIQKVNGSQYEFAINAEQLRIVLDRDEGFARRAQALRDAVLNWCDTPQGAVYWNDVYDNLKNAVPLHLAEPILRGWLALAEAQLRLTPRGVATPGVPRASHGPTVEAAPPPRVPSGTRTLRCRNESGSEFVFEFNVTNAVDALDTGRSARERADSLDEAFCYSLTPQGDDYWCSIYRTLRDDGTLQLDAESAIRMWLAAVDASQRDARASAPDGHLLPAFLPALVVSDAVELSVLAMALGGLWEVASKADARGDSFTAADGRKVSEVVQALVDRCAKVIAAREPKPAPEQERVVLETDMSIFDV